MIFVESFLLKIEMFVFTFDLFWTRSLKNVFISFYLLFRDVKCLTLFEEIISEKFFHEMKYSSCGTLGGKSQSLRIWSVRTYKFESDMSEYICSNVTCSNVQVRMWSVLICPKMKCPNVMSENMTFSNVICPNMICSNVICSNVICPNLICPNLISSNCKLGSKIGLQR